MSINFKSYVQRESFCMQFLSRMLRDSKSQRNIKTLAGFSLLPIGVVFALYIYLENTPNLLSAGSFVRDLQGASFERGQMFSKRPLFLNDLGKNEFLRAYTLFESPENDAQKPAISFVDRKCLDTCDNFEYKLRQMVAGFPFEVMVPYIIQQDKIVAAMLVGIAKKESDWGKHSPSKDGLDCFNYWGYKGRGSRGVSSGYGCFATPEEAIRVVGGRIYELSVELKKDTPEKMIIWKCGNSCRGHSLESVSRWIYDVDIYFSRLIALG